MIGHVDDVIIVFGPGRRIVGKAEVDASRLSFKTKALGDWLPSPSGWRIRDMIARAQLMAALSAGTGLSFFQLASPPKLLIPATLVCFRSGSCNVPIYFLQHARHIFHQLS